MLSATKKLIVGVMAILLFTSQASAADRVRVASVHEGLWDMTMVKFGKEKGIYAKHGLDMDIQWVHGGAAHVQSVVTGTVDMAFGASLMGTIGAYKKGVPVEILAAAMTGSSDLFWYVKGDSDIKSFADTNGRTVAYSAPGSSTSLIAAALVHSAGATEAKLVPTGGIPATMTQVLTGQVDVGWAGLPIGMDRAASGEIRILGNGNMVPGLKDRTVRAYVVNREFLKANRELVERVMAAHKEVLDWAYGTDEAIEMYAKTNKVSFADAKKARDLGYPPEAMQMFPIKDIEGVIHEAVESKRIDAPLTAAETEELLAVSKEMAKVVN